MNVLDNQIEELEARLSELKKKRGIFVALFCDGKEVNYEGYERVRIDGISFLLDRDMNFMTEDPVEFPENESDTVTVNQLGLFIDNEQRLLVPIENETFGYYENPKFTLRVKRES